MNEITEKTACFTGHRRIIHKHMEERVTDVIRTLAESGVVYFGTGGALGFDMLAAKCVLQLKKEIPQLKLIVVIPCKSQTRGWSEKHKQEYEYILSKADKVTMLSEKYYRGCMLARNRHLVDGSAVCIYYMYKESGGTAYTVSYARKKGRILVGII